MTATRLFFLFLKEECTIAEMRFFKWTIMSDCGNRYFRKRPLFKPTFVEDYLSRNDRALNNFITRLFILAPNLVNNRHRNPRWKMIKDDFNNRNLGKTHTVKIKDWFGNETGETYTVPIQFKPYLKGMYVNYYRRKWNQFLKDKIESDKKFNSSFKKGESYEFRYKG
jgi:hypothetical protein